MTEQKPTQKLSLEEARIVDLDLLRELQGKVVNFCSPLEECEMEGILGRIGLTLIEMCYVVRNDLEICSKDSRTKEMFRDRVIYNLPQLERIREDEMPTQTYKMYYEGLKGEQK